MTDMTSTPSKLRKSMQPSVANDPRWARIVARDKTADGQVWYSVDTTGVYCRATCASRIANPRNVQLHDTLESAKATGFRPCKRCNPDGLSIEAENAALVARVCRIIEASEEEPSLEALAKAVDLSPSYFHRMFKAATGVTPKNYAPPIARRSCGTGWPLAAPLPKRSMTRASIRAGASTKSRPRCSA
jgi:AraC family transcriptional regulator of adaptative response/methylated-DNA-[protein]-cysteine methyltransferase